MSKYSKKNVIIEGNKLMMRKNAFYVLVVSFLMQINILCEYWLTFDDFIDTYVFDYLFVFFDYTINIVNSLPAQQNLNGYCVPKNLVFKDFWWSFIQVIFIAC
jgi:hypothetical protein